MTVGPVIELPDLPALFQCTTVSANNNDMAGPGYVSAVPRYAVVLLEENAITLVRNLSSLTGDVSLDHASHYEMRPTVQFPRVGPGVHILYYFPGGAFHITMLPSDPRSASYLLGFYGREPTRQCHIIGHCDESGCRPIR